MHIKYIMMYSNGLQWFSITYIKPTLSTSSVCTPQEEFVRGALAQLEAERDEARRQLEEEHRLHMAARHQTALALSLEHKHHSHSPAHDQHDHDHDHDHSLNQHSHCDHSHGHSGQEDEDYNSLQNDRSCVCVYVCVLG